MKRVVIALLIILGLFVVCGTDACIQISVPDGDGGAPATQPATTPGAQTPDITTPTTTTPDTTTPPTTTPAVTGDISVKSFDPISGDERNPVISNNGEKIIFIVDGTEGQDNLLYSINSDGSGLTKIFEDGTIITRTDDDGDVWSHVMDSAPKISGDGKKVIVQLAEKENLFGYAWWDVDWIGVMNVDGTGFKAIPITTKVPRWIGPSNYYTINYDGSKILTLVVYAEEGQDGRDAPNYQLVVMNSDGTDQSVIAECARPNIGCPAPGANIIIDNHLLFNLADDANKKGFSLYSSALGGTSKNEIMSHTEGTWGPGCYVQASKDGKVITFNSDSTTQIISNGVQSELTVQEDSVSHHYTDLCSDGKKIVVRDSPNAWYLKDIASGEELLINADGKALEFTDLHSSIIETRACGVTSAGEYKVLFRGIDDDLLYVYTIK